MNKAPPSDVSSIVARKTAEDLEIEAYACAVSVGFDAAHRPLQPLDLLCDHSPLRRFLMVLADELVGAGLKRSDADNPL
jgi:hypothetical protein